jgi:hypothetical protein
MKHFSFSLFILMSLFVSACHKNETGDMNDIERQEEVPVNDLNKERGDELDVP